MGYALSQRNNHAISELVFLLSLPGKPNGRLCRLLREALDDQFFDDGSYAQQSHVYERLAVHALVWLMLVRPDLPPAVGSRTRSVLDRAAAFLQRCSDPVSGLLANYGANDGSLLFPLAAAAPLDVRPTLAMLGRPCGSVGLAEPQLWIDPLVPTDRPLQSSTYFTLRTDRTLLSTRIGHVPGGRPTPTSRQSSCSSTGSGSSSTLAHFGIRGAGRGGIRSSGSRMHSGLRATRGEPTEELGPVSSSPR